MKIKHRIRTQSFPTKIATCAEFPTYSPVRDRMAVHRHLYRLAVQVLEHVHALVCRHDCLDNGQEIHVRVRSRKRHFCKLPN